LEDCLGKGKFGVVYAAKHMNSDMRVAVKKIKKSEMKTNEVEM
jgi:serine/threonine protein kinase